MTTATITFPDSGKTLEIERVSFLTLAMLRAHYERSYDGKPSIPLIKIDDTTEENPNDAEYKKALSEWDTRMKQAQWLATKMLYAKSVKQIDLEQVAKAIADVAPYMDLKQEIINAYHELNVPLDESYLDAYIYLWHVCITNGAEQNLFTSEMTSGSGAAHEAVQNALFRLRSQI